MALRCRGVVVLRCCATVSVDSCQATHLLFYISPYQYYPSVPPPSFIQEPNEAARAHECVAATKTNHPLVRFADDA